MAYRRSDPLLVWLQEPSVLKVLADAHRHIGQVPGPGRPQEIGRLLAHAYLLQMVADFQRFARGLHDLAAEIVAANSGAHPHHQAMLVTAATQGRAIDRGNADLRALKNDFRRLGLAQLGTTLSMACPDWPDTIGKFDSLIDLRNAIAHGNQQQIQSLRGKGSLDTRTWVKGRLPACNRLAKALDRVVWNHLSGTFQKDPW